MAGDYTRFTFRPQKGYSGIFKQQGRVDLDADFNELIETVDRRWRSETIDIVSHCVVPNTTPNAFLITPTSMGDFEIGIGRMYVDGIQVENHGLPPLEYRADLGETRGTVRVPYSNQPYLPNPLPPPLTPPPLSNRTDLVYLDVWQREVTALEDPSIREIALGGPDTTTRIQSVWQVRVLENVGTHGCGDSIDQWDLLIAPSAGRLTTSAVAPPASDDPCIISPTGGYRGVENRLYRVEIHSTGSIGGVGAAKFKWSRNNATIASTISAISPPTQNQATVQQIGRDQVLRFDIGNWIEITDDFREFQGLAGHMAQITAIDEANRVLTFAPAIPGTMNFDATDPSRHTRVRRWDQSQNVDANGLLDVTAGPVDIEDGIRVSFSLDPVTGSFKVGDYWNFAARTADGSVEILDTAPPRGILHHYCRLGFIHWGADIGTTSFTDCRPPWPPACECGCCTVTVGDGIDSHGQFTDIQQAINALGNRGGVVCIGRGFYTVRTGLILNNTKRNVILRGMGPATRILFAPETPGVFLNIQGTEHVRLESVFVVSLAAEALVRMTNSRFCRIENCILINVPGRPTEQAPAGRAIDFGENCSSCEIARNALLAAKAVTSTSGQVRELEVRDNLILALQVSVFIFQGEGVEIVHNQMRGLPRVAFTTDINRSTIDAFQVSVSNAFRATPAFSNFQAAGVLIFTGNRIVLSQNLITAQVAVLGFLFLNARIRQNDIVSLIGALIVYGIRVKIEDNFVLGLFAGLIHAGIIVDLDCTSNEWLGFYGILWMSLAELTQIFAPLLGTAIGSAKLASSGPAAVNTTATVGTNLAGNLRAFGLALVNKVHRNVFFTFSRGIYKTDAVVSADISIVDNTFSLCAQAAIVLGGAARNTGFLTSVLNVISLRHLIQSNAVAVLGRGMLSSNYYTDVEANSVQCPSVAIELAAPFSTARDNSLIGTALEMAQPGPADEGLIILHGTAIETSVSGNRLFNASGHGILLRGNLFNVAIEDNQIELVRRLGIGTVNNTTSLSRSTISRNRVRTCQGNVPLGSHPFGGAIVIGAGQEVRFIDNVVTDNTPPTPGDQPLRWFAVYFDKADGVEISGNTVIENAGIAGVRGMLGAIRLAGVRHAIRIQNNIVRDNGGIPLFIGEFLPAAVAPPPVQIQPILVQDNHFSQGPSPQNFSVLVIANDSLLFQGNQCMGVGQQQSPLLPVALVAARANVTGNAVDFANPFAMFVMGVDLIVNANSARSGAVPLIVVGTQVVVTSNLTTGVIFPPPPLPPPSVRANNIPPP